MDFDNAICPLATRSLLKQNEIQKSPVFALIEL